MKKNAASHVLVAVPLALSLTLPALPAQAETNDGLQANEGGEAQGSLAGLLSPAAEALACADSGVVAARKSVVNAEAAVASAQAAYDAADAEAAPARQKLADGAFAFFEDMGATGALAALNSDSLLRWSGGTVENLTRRGEETDATSVTNMLASIPYMKKCNEIRASEGLDALKVGLDHMAFAMFNANWSDANEDNANVQPFRSRTSLAWGTSDPFDLWYTQEKAIAESSGPYAISTPFKDYKDIVSESNVVTGYAINTKGTLYANCHAESFSDYIQDGEKTVTVDEYESMLQSWIASQNEEIGKVDAARESLDWAQAELAAANAALEKAEAPYSFADVDYSLYYGPTVAAAAKDGLMSGYSGSTSFGPEDVMTRGQLATVLWRAACPDEAAAYDEAGAANATGMGDVEAGKFYTAAANWAVSAGVINGFEVDGHREFKPYEPVTMEQLCCIVANFRGESYGANNLAGQAVDGFADGQAVSPWAAGSVSWAAKHGWVSGYEVGGGARELRPGEALARGRAATILENSGVLSAHEHEWVEATGQVWVPNVVVVQEAYDEPVYESKAVHYCGVCETPMDENHGWEVHISKGDYSYWGYVKQEKVQTGTIHHDAVTEDQGRYEDKVTGYVCAGCGERKE